MIKASTLSKQPRTLSSKNPQNFAHKLLSRGAWVMEWGLNNPFLNPKLAKRKQKSLVAGILLKDNGKSTIKILTYVEVLLSLFLR